MSRAVLRGALVLGLMACSSVAAREPGDRALDRTLVAGTLIEATIQDALSWRCNKPGATLTAIVSADVSNGRRWVVIPARSPVALRIAPAGRGPVTNKSQADVRIALDVTSVTVSGQAYPVSATVDLTLAAVRWASHDVVVAPGTQIRFVLPSGFTISRRLIASSFDARQIRAPAHRC
jgi:hypothetical protein